MRDYIFCFEQKRAVELNLKLSELLILDYFQKFFASDKIKKYQYNNRDYFRITYSKILSDLPILNIKERQLRNLLIELEEKKIIFRFFKSSTQLFISVDFDFLFGKNIPEQNFIQVENFQIGGNNLLTIDNKDREKLYIEQLNARNIKNIPEFCFKFHEYLIGYFSKMFYDICLKNIKICEITEKYIVFFVNKLSFFKESILDKIKLALKNTMEFFNYM